MVAEPPAADPDEPPAADATAPTPSMLPDGGETAAESEASEGETSGGKTSESDATGSDATGPTDTEAAIMDATYRALLAHGYADLSISRIAEEFSKSKSLLYYHYEDRDELLVAFLDHVLEEFAADIAVDPERDPAAQLDELFDRLLPATATDEKRAFQAALFELRAQAPHEAAYRERFARTDRLVRETIADCIAVGIEEGRFRDVDPDATARLLLALLNGGMAERVTAPDAADVTALRTAIDEFVATRLLGRTGE